MLPPRPPRRTPRVLVALLVAGCAALAAPARAADPDYLQTSLKLMPADAAFYTSMLHNREQIDALTKSRAWAKVWSLPAVEQGWKAFEAEYKKPGGNLAELRRFLEEDENKELLALLEDAGSEDVFVYGDDGWVGLVDLSQQLNSAIQYQPLLAQLSGEDGGHSQDELQARAALSLLAKNPDKIKIPNLVLGFKLSDAKRAEKQIKRLEALAGQFADQVPELKGRVKRAKVGVSSFLRLTLEGSQVPWDAVPWKKYEDKPGEFAPVVRKLKGLTLTVGIGVMDDYLLVGVGGSADAVGRLMDRSPRLDQQPEIKPLAKIAGKKLTSITYVSKAFNQVAASRTGNMDSLVDLAKAALARSDLPEDQRKAILKDLADFVRDVKALQPEAGSLMSFTFLTDRGFEGYSYDFGKHPAVDGSKPLTLLSHLGGNPLLAVVARGKTSVEDYEEFVKRIKTVYARADEIIRTKLTGDDKERYLKVRADLLPLLQRLDETTDKLFLPALADGQAALVLDAKWTSKQWAKNQPATDKALPAPEIGVVLAVSDADSLRKALAEYRKIANEALTKARSWPDSKLPELQIPPPKSVKKKGATLYFYPLPEEWGVDPQVTPTAGLSADAVALTLSHAHAERLLAATPLKVDGGPLADLDRPLAAAAYLDWAGMVDAFTPWVELAMSKTLDAQPGLDVPGKARDDVVRQVRTVLEVLKCCRGATSATYLEDGALVTHSEAVIRDLEK